MTDYRPEPRYSDWGGGGDAGGVGGGGGSPDTVQRYTRWYRNTAAVRNCIASNNVRILCLGDSEILGGGSATGYKGGAMAMAQIGVFGHIRAWQDFVTPSSPYLITSYMSTGGGTERTYNRDASPATGVPFGTEFVGIPVGVRGIEISSASWAPGGKMIASLTIDRAPMLSAVHPISSTMIGVRPLFYCPNDTSTLYGAVGSAGNFTLHDTYNTPPILATQNFASTANVDGTIGAPVPGAINRLQKDVGLTTQTGTAYTLLYLHTGSNVGDDGLFSIVNPIFYEVSNADKTDPHFVGGNYLQILAGASYMMGNMVISPSPLDGTTYRKCDTDLNWLQFIKASTLDASQRVLIVWRGDTEYSETVGNYPELGPVTLKTQEDYVAFIQAIVGRFDFLCALAGLQQPIYWFQQMPHHWHTSSGGFGEGVGSASKDNEINAARHDIYRQALDQVAQSNSRIAYTSMFAWFHAQFPDSLGGAADMAAATELLDSAFGANWVPPGTSFSAYTPGTGGDAGDLMDGNGLHSASANVERVFAQIMAWSLEGDTGFSGTAGRIRTRSRNRGTMP